MHWEEAVYLIEASKMKAMVIKNRPIPASLVIFCPENNVGMIVSAVEQSLMVIMSHLSPLVCVASSP